MSASLSRVSAPLRAPGVNALALLAGTALLALLAGFVAVQPGGGWRMPALVLAGWWVWSRDMPQSSAAAFAAGLRDAFLWKPVWIQVFFIRALACLPLVALSAWAAVPSSRSGCFAGRCC